MASHDRFRTVHWQLIQQYASVHAQIREVHDGDPASGSGRPGLRFDQTDNYATARVAKFLQSEGLY